MKKVLVAMSGGVDSSVTAAFLKQRGYEVIGGTMNIIPDFVRSVEDSENCSALSAVEDAKKVAKNLDIPHYTFNFQDVFEEEVVNNFVSEYSKARTPNPCVVCNKKIKFDALLEKALEMDIDYIATGHYARIQHNQEERNLLYKAVDDKKDQSYMLYGLSQYQLAHTLMPLGDYNKNEVREIAEKLGFKIHDKPDSQEICFIPDDNYKNFLEDNYSQIGEPGPILNTNGEKIGRHEGLYKYTIGQRRGLGISFNYPVYVIGFDRKKNALIVGKNNKVFNKGLIANKLNWIAFDYPENKIKVKAQIRYNSSPVDATIYTDNGKKNIKVVFEEKQRAITPGQSVVFYKNKLVLGGGVINNSFG